MSDTWYYSRGGQQAGPVTWAALYQLAQSGQIQATDMVWREGTPDWVQAGTIRELGLGGHAAPPQYAAPSGISYYTPTRVAPQDSGDMTGADWVIAILCPGIGCIIGIVRLIQGKSSGGKMLGMSILFAVIWNIVRFAIMTAGH